MIGLLLSFSFSLFLSFLSSSLLAAYLRVEFLLLFGFFLTCGLWHVRMIDCICFELYGKPNLLFTIYHIQLARHLGTGDSI